MSEIVVEGLSLTKKQNGASTNLLKNIHLRLQRGRPLILIGESGCGKTLVAQAIIGTVPRDMEAQGKILFAGIDLLSCDKKMRHQLWGRNLFLLPQQPGSYLNPLVRSLPQISEVYRRVRGYSRKDAKECGRKMMQDVGLMREDERKYPWQLSGGMGQRLLTAIAMAQPAQVIIADEPTKGLDGPAKKQSISLLKQLSDSGKSLLIITHDLAVPKVLGGDLAVMYNGQIVEIGPVWSVLQRPLHPYTKALQRAHPANGLEPIPRKVNGNATLHNPYCGCSFSPRCQRAFDFCFTNHPDIDQNQAERHMVACHRESHHVTNG